MKDIKKALNEIQRSEKISDKIQSLLSSKRGKQFIADFATRRYTIEELIRKYEITYIRTHRGKLILKNLAAKNAQENIIDYTKIADSEISYKNKRKKFVENWQKEKHQFVLAKYEQKLLNKRDQWKIKMDSRGKPIIKCEKKIRDGETAPRILYDAQTGLPIYQFTPKTNKTGLALKLHMLETHKMEKYDKVAKQMQERDCEQDLFPEQIVAKYKMLREAHLEQLREDLANTYTSRKVTVVIQNKDTDEVTKIPTNLMVNMGTIRKRKLTRNKTRAQLIDITSGIINNNPKCRITCVHLDGPKDKYGKVILPETFGLAA